MEVSTFWACEPDEVADNPFLVRIPTIVYLLESFFTASCLGFNATRSITQTLLEAVAEGDLCILEAALSAQSQLEGLGYVPPRPLPPSINPPSVVACLHRQQDALELLLERDPGSIDAVDICHGAGLLHWAAHVGDTGILAFLLQQKSSLLHVRDDQSMLPIHYAAENGKRAALRLLVDASPNDANAVAAHPSGATPLLLAARHGHNRCVEYLVAHGADINASDMHGSTALLEAAKEGHMSTAKILLNAGILPSSSDSVMKRTALHWAAYHGDVQSTKLLVQKKPELVFGKDCKG